MNGPLAEAALCNNAQNMFQKVRFATVALFTRFFRISWIAIFVAQRKRWAVVLSILIGFAESGMANPIYVTTTHQGVTDPQNCSLQEAIYAANFDANIAIALHHNHGEPLDASAVRAIALHEVGHLLGLDHCSDTTNIMTPRVRVRELSEADKATMRLIYALPPGSVKQAMAGG